MKWLRLAAIGVLLLAAVFVGLLPANNSEPVSLHYIVGQTAAVPLFWVVFGSVLLGILVAALPFLYLHLKRSLVMRRYRKVISRLETEVHQLRSLPLESNHKPDAVVSADPEAIS